MNYLFAENIEESFQDGIVFTADNGYGEVKNNILSISDSKKTYVYKNNQWYLNKFPCGNGAVPVLDLNNIIIKNNAVFSKITYKSLEV